MSDVSFDFTPYMRAPILTLESGIALCRTLVAACPKGMTAQVKQGADKLSRIGDAAQAALAQRQREGAPITDEDRRTIDIEADQAWGGMRQRLEAYGALPEARFKKAPRARELWGLLFGEGTAFLRAPYAEQYVVMDTLLQRIDKEHLAKDLDDVCGPEFLAQIRHVHPRYAAMVQRRAEQAPAAENLSTHLRAMGRAVVEYATRVVATVDSDDDKTLERAQQALRPIDAHRDQAARRSSGNSSGSSGTDPTPPSSPPESPTS